MWPPDEEQETLRLVKRDNSFSLIFFSKIGIYRVRVVVCGATRWVQPTWVRQERGARPGGLCPPRGPSPVGLGSRNSYYWYKKSSQNFVPFRELLFLHKNNTMVVLLKTTLVRVSFIQIMQIRVQNNRKLLGKVDMMETYQFPQASTFAFPQAIQLINWKWKRKNFYKLFCSDRKSVV